MFELSIYTHGNREYAVAMARLLDPHKQLFAERIISAVSCAGGQLNEGLVRALQMPSRAWGHHEANVQDQFKMVSKAACLHALRANSLQLLGGVRLQGASL